MEIAVVGGLARIESLSSALETVTVSMSAIAIRAQVAALRYIDPVRCRGFRNRCTASEIPRCALGRRDDLGTEAGTKRRERWDQRISSVPTKGGKNVGNQ